MADTTKETFSGAICEALGISDARQKATAARRLAAAWKDATLALGNQPLCGVGLPQPAFVILAVTVGHGVKEISMHCGTVIGVRSILVQDLPVAVLQMGTGTGDNLQLARRRRNVHVDELGDGSKVVGEIGDVRVQASEHESTITVEPRDRFEVKARFIEVAVEPARRL